jgi:hypothetical protein
MRSIRLEADLDEKIQRAAKIKGESVSKFIRQAAAERAEQTLSKSPSDYFADVAGVIHGGGGRARSTGSAFKQVIAENHSK